MTATVRGISAAGREGSMNKDGIKEFRAVYKVTTDDKNDGPEIVRTAFGIPNIGDIYSSGNDYEPNAVVIDKQTRQNEDSPWEWEVEVTYSTETDEPVIYGDPLSEPAEVSYGFQARRFPVVGLFSNPSSPPASKDFNGWLYAPNGEPFNPQPEIELNEPVLTIAKNFQSISGAVLMALANAVNSDYWQGAEPRQLRMMAPQAVRKWHKNVGNYWTVTYSMAYRWETWDLQLLNQGTYYWASARPTSVWSTTVARLVKTDNAGNVLPVNLNANGTINTTGVPTWTRLRIYREISFSALGLI